MVHYRSGAQATVDAIASFGEGHTVSADLTDATAIQAMFAPSAAWAAGRAIVHGRRRTRGVAVGYST